MKIFSVSADLPLSFCPVIIDCQVQVFLPGRYTALRSIYSWIKLINHLILEQHNIKVKNIYKHNKQVNNIYKHNIQGTQYL